VDGNDCDRWDDGQLMTLLAVVLDDREADCAERPPPVAPDDCAERPPPVAPDDCAELTLPVAPDDCAQLPPPAAPDDRPAEFSLADVVAAGRAAYCWLDVIVTLRDVARHLGPATGASTAREPGP
jgi:hypothetical protein